MSLTSVRPHDFEGSHPHLKVSSDFATALAEARRVITDGDPGSGTRTDHKPEEHDNPPTRPKVAIPEHFADPSIVKGSNGRYYAFATAGNDHILQVSHAPSPGGPWSKPSKVTGLTKHTNHLSWAKLDKGIWAPDVHEVAPGQFVMFFSAQSNEKHGGRRAIGYATGTLQKDGNITWTVGDPAKPLIHAPHGDGGAIDPSLFTEHKDGHTYTYIVYKNDGNSIKEQHDGKVVMHHGKPVLKPDTIWLQQVNPDKKYRPVGKPKPLLTNNAKHKQEQHATGVPPGTIIEAPQIVHHGNEYVMFYSTGHYHNGSYAEHYAIAKSPDGPWRYGGTLLKTHGINGHGGLKGPGGATVMGNVIVFHNISPGTKFGREMMVAKLQWDQNGHPYVEGGK